jgi:hypothetical protein
MKVTKTQETGAVTLMAGSVTAGGVIVEDPGGYFPPGLTLEEILALIGAGTYPGSFLTTTLGGQGVVQALGTLGATETIDLANANKFWGTLDQDCTITTVGWTNLKDAQISVELIQDGTGGWTPTFSGVTWIGGTPDWVTTAGTVTHVVLFSRDGGTTIYGVVVGMGGSGGTLPWFNVTEYGAVGDGTADDTTPVNDAIAAYNAAGGGVLYFPEGSYKITAALTALAAPGLVLGDGMGTSAYATRIVMTSATAVLFESASDGISYRGLYLFNSAATPTAGTAILASAGIQARYEDLAIVGFYDNMDLATGSVWAMTRCDIGAPIRYGVRVRNSTNPDAGDSTISDCVISAFDNNATAALRLESSGGLRIVNTKFNGVAGSGLFANHIDIAPVGVTTILLVANCSFENYSGDAIHYDDSVSAGGWDMISVIGCQFGQYGNGTGRAVYINGANDVLITHAILRADTGTPTAVSLNNGARAVVGPFTNNGFATLLASSAYSSIDDRTTAGSGGAPTTADYLVGTANGSLSAEIVVGTSPGGELGGTWASPTVDTVHSGSAHMTAAAISAAGFVGPILMTDGITSPPEPLWSEDGTDYLYQDMG